MEALAPPTLPPGFIGADGLEDGADGGGEELDDEEMAKWYAAAAEGYSDDEYEDEAEEAAEPEADAGEQAAPTDPYAVVEEDPYIAASVDPYSVLTGDDAAVPAAPADDKLGGTSLPPAAEKRPLEDPVAEAGATETAAESAPWQAQRKRRRKTPRPKVAEAEVVAEPEALPPVLQTQDPPVGMAPTPPPPAQSAPPPEFISLTTPVAAPDPQIEAVAATPEPAPTPPEVDTAPASQENVEEPDVQTAPDADMSELVADAEAPEGEPREGVDAAEDAEVEMPWDEKVIVVRQGQIYIELQRRNPPMHDASLLKFCDWLDVQLPLVAANFPYIRKSGAYVDLSDNVIGPNGLDKLFRVLRQHRVPCLVMKCYRNALDDGIIDTLIEYLYTQPESFPMHGIHISHNSISDKGAFRLIRAAASCGHYPRYTSRLPLWLRLESNEIKNPQRVIADCNTEGFNVCLMKDGLCSRDDCNHYSGVHVQLPYFLHNPGRFGSKPAVPQACVPVPAVEETGEDPGIVQVPEPPTQDKAEEIIPIVADEVSEPDWRKNSKITRQAPKRVGIPAPKKAGFRPAQPAGPPVIAEADPQARTHDVPAEGETQEAASADEQMEQDAASLYEIFRGGAPPADESQPPAQETPVDQPLAAEDSLDQPPAVEESLEQPPAQEEPPAPRLFAVLKPTPKIKAGGGKASWNTNGDKPWKGGGWNNDQRGGWKNGGANWPNGGSWGGGKGGDRGGWKGGGDKQGGKGWSNDGGKGKGGGGKKGWQGPALTSKRKVEVQLKEVDKDLGFTWEVVAAGLPPRVTSVAPGSKVAEAVRVGTNLLRMNGLDAAMFTEKQVNDVLRQRPLTLRFGDA